jgi:predicted Zn-dependent peptidase
MLFKGTPSRGPEQIARELDGLGGASNAFTSKESTCLYATVLDSQLPALISIYSDLFLHSEFNRDEVLRERSVILQELDMVEDTPEDLVHDLFASMIWAGHPLSNTVLGSRENVSSMTPERLRGFVNGFYSPEKIVIAAAGGLEHDSFVDLLAEKFSTLPQRHPGEISADCRSRRTRPELLAGRREICSRPFEQAHIVLGTYGLPADAPERYALLLLNILLGGNMSSRLFQELREKRGLAYSIGSFTESNIDSGHVGIYTGVNPRNAEESIELIEEIAAGLARGDVLENDLQRAKGYARAGLYLAAENMDSRMMRLAKNEFIFKRQISLAEVDSALARVGVDEVNTLAVELFAEPMSGFILGPISDHGVVNW